VSNNGVPITYVANNDTHKRQHSYGYEMQSDNVLHEQNYSHRNCITVNTYFSTCNTTMWNIFAANQLRGVLIRMHKNPGKKNIQNWKIYANNGDQ